MKNISVTVLMFVGLGLLISCSTAPIIEDSSPNAISQWESKAQITDRKTQKSQSVSVDFVAAGRSRLRMEVSGTFATTLAVAVLNRDQLTYVLPRQKQFYQGQATGGSFRPLMQIELEPSQLFRLLYDEPMQGAGWSCQKNAEGLTATCENADTKLKISWLRREQHKKNIQISGERFDVTINLERVPTKVQDASKVFTLSIPQGFRNNSGDSL